ncbi:PREDICTED: uncharacterized protein LOC108358080 [Rhagoletis zephyria]|uniref:uncharacterized protein LOC108358080 n=1 Tax=Rhagoletis zephyria TaxID=28612 RepID=UPI00081124B4|nr:PREDICTED: uncharacterized protein LOC108358080 [Rhagoletis zephyria]
MRIRRPRGITVQQLMIVTAVGFLGGVYIWKPLILKYRAESEDPTGESVKESASTVSSSVLPTKTSTETMSSTNLVGYIKNSPIAVMAAGIFSTLAIVGTYRFAIRPRLERRRREEAESYAEYIFQQEQSHKADLK